MVVDCGLTDLPVLVSGGPQFLIGGVLECEQGVVGTGNGQQDLVELALRRPLMPGLGVLDDKDHREGQRGHQGLEDGLPPRGKSGRDAHGDPHPDPAGDNHRGERPGCMPVDPRQPPAETGTLRGRNWLGHRTRAQLRLAAADRTALLTLRLAARACLLAAMVLRSVPGSPSGTLYPAASPANGCASGWLRSAQDPIMPLRQPGWRPCIPRPGG